MNHSGAQYPPLPIITHTAATPQDSPNNTLDVRGFNNQLTNLLSANSSILSIDSIDYSSVSIHLKSNYPSLELCSCS